MKRKILTLLLAVLLNLSNVNAQRWTVYNTDNSEIAENEISDIAIDAQNNKWIATFYGVSKFNGTTWTNYQRNNSGLVSNLCHAIAIDGSGNVWIGTENGISKFDGTNWTTYQPIPFGGGPARAGTLSITVDSKGNIWFGHYESWLSKFDGTNWTTYGVGSGVGSFNVTSLGVDASDNIWFSLFGGGVGKLVGTNIYRIGTGFEQLLDKDVRTLLIEKQKGKAWFASYGGISLLTVSIWTQYSGLDFNLPGTIYAIGVDGQDNKWFGGDNGLVKFNGSTWTTFDKTNSGLPDWWVEEIAIESNGVLWLGNKGLVRFDPNDRTDVAGINTPSKLLLYPNPVIDKLIISGQKSNSKISICDMKGQLILNQELSGNEIDISHLTKGLYVIQITDGDGVYTQKIIKQ